MFAIHKSSNHRPFAWRFALWSVLVALLVIPLVAMQFTHEVVWDRFDFAAAAAILACVGFAIELSSRFIETAFSRGLIISLIVTVGMAVWLQGAVGLI